MSYMNISEIAKEFTESGATIKEVTVEDGHTVVRFSASYPAVFHVIGKIREGRVSTTGEISISGGAITLKPVYENGVMEVVMRPDVVDVKVIIDIHKGSDGA
jgi:hypothetical protein